MKKLYKPLGIILLVLFVLATAKVIYEIYTFEEAITQKLVIGSAEQIEKIKPNINVMAVFVGIAFLAGLLSILFLILGDSSESNKQRVVYVEKNSDGTTTTLDASIVEASNPYEDDTDEIKVIIASAVGDSKETIEKVISAICTKMYAAQGAIYLTHKIDGIKVIELQAGYAYYTPDSQKVIYEFGEGLAGQVAKDKKTVMVDSIPEGYMTVVSGLGSASPRNLLIAPIQNSYGEILGVVEIASFEKFEDAQKTFVEKVTDLLADQLESNPLFEE